MLAADPKESGWTALVGLVFLLAAAGSLAAWIWALRRWWQLRCNRINSQHLPATHDGHEIDYESAQSASVSETKVRFPRWRGSTVLISAGIYFLLQVLVVLVVVRPHKAGAEEAAAKASELSPLLMVQVMTAINLLVALIIPVVIWITSGIGPRTLGLLPTRAFWGDVKLGVLSFFLVAPLVYLTFATAGQIWQRQEHPMFETIKERGAGTSAALSLVSAAFAAPVAEELLFRGVLLGWLTTVAAAGALRTGRIRSAVGGEIFKDATGEVLVLEYDDLAVPIELHTEPRLAQKLDWKATWIPNILVSLLFAGMHYAQWPSPVALFPLSLALGWLAHRTGRITASIVLHAAFNGFSTTMLLLVTQAGLPTGP